MNQQKTLARLKQRLARASRHVYELYKCTNPLAAEHQPLSLQSSSQFQQKRNHISLLRDESLITTCSFNPLFHSVCFFINLLLVIFPSKGIHTMFPDLHSLSSFFFLLLEHLIFSHFVLIVVWKFRLYYMITNLHSLSYFLRIFVVLY